jgi:hypothetical protein
MAGVFGPELDTSRPQQIFYGLLTNPHVLRTILGVVPVGCPIQTLPLPVREFRYSHYYLCFDVFSSSVASSTDPLKTGQSPNGQAFFTVLVRMPRRYHIAPWLAIKTPNRARITDSLMGEFLQ